MNTRAMRVLLAALATLVAPGLAGAVCVATGAAPDAPLALVLSGGGAKGAWEAGVATALVEAGVPVSVVAGSSAGALNAAMLADGRLDALERVWRTLTPEQVYALRPPVFFAGFLPGWLTLLVLDHARALLDPQPLRDLLTATLDLQRVRASPRRLLVMATDLVRKERRVFDNGTVTVDALLAAAAVPGVFPPVEVDGGALVDGGLLGRAPVLEALASGVPVGRALVVVSYAAAPAPNGTRPTLRKVLEDAFELSMVHQIRRDAELATLRHPAVDVQLLEPSAPLELRPLGFEPAALARALERGKADGLRCLRAWRG